MKIVVLDGYTLNPGDLSWNELKKMGEFTVYDRTLPEEVIKRAENADVIFTNKVVINASIPGNRPDSLDAQLSLARNVLAIV